MNTHNLIDLETKIHYQLTESCNMDLEANEFIEKELHKTASFGEKEIQEIQDAMSSFVKNIAYCSQKESLPLIDKLNSIFKKISLASLKPGFHGPLYRFLASKVPFNSTNPLKRNRKRLEQLDIIFNKIFNYQSSLRSKRIFFDSFTEQTIKILENIDKQILLGKCVLKKLESNDSVNEHNLYKEKIKERIFLLELTKNIPLQIIAKIQTIEELYEDFVVTYEERLLKSLSLFITDYKEALSKKENVEINKLLELFRKILQSVNNLKIIEADLDNKLDDLKTTIILFIEK